MGRGAGAVDVLISGAFSQAPPAPRARVSAAGGRGTSAACSFPAPRGIPQCHPLPRPPAPAPGSPTSAPWSPGRPGRRGDRAVGALRAALPRLRGRHGRPRRRPGVGPGPAGGAACLERRPRADGCAPAVDAAGARAATFAEAFFAFVAAPRRAVDRRRTCTARPRGSRSSSCCGTARSTTSRRPTRPRGWCPRLPARREGGADGAAVRRVRRRRPATGSTRTCSPAGWRPAGCGPTTAPTSTTYRSRSSSRTTRCRCSGCTAGCAGCARPPRGLRGDQLAALARWRRGSSGSSSRRS